MTSILFCLVESESHYEPIFSLALIYFFFQIIINMNRNTNMYCYLRATCWLSFLTDLKSHRIMARYGTIFSITQFRHKAT